MSVYLFAIDLPSYTNNGPNNIFGFYSEKVSITRKLSGATIIKGTIPFEKFNDESYKIKPFKYAIGLAVNESIIGVGVVQPGAFDHKGSWTWVAEGFSGYMYNIFYRGDPIVANGIDLESYILENLRSTYQLWMENCGTTKIGNLPGYGLMTNHPNFKNGNAFTTPSAYVDVDDAPIPEGFISLREVDQSSCGEKIEAAIKACKTDFREKYWLRRSTRTGPNSSKDFYEVGFNYELFDVLKQEFVKNAQNMFVVGENVDYIVPQELSVNDFITHASVDGAKVENVKTNDDYRIYGAAKIANVDQVDIEVRLKNENVNNYQECFEQARQTLAHRRIKSSTLNIKAVSSHINASFGTFDVGDVVHVFGHVPWYGEIDGNVDYIVTQIEYSLDDDDMMVTVAPKSVFSSSYSTSSIRSYKRKTRKSQKYANNFYRTKVVGTSGSSAWTDFFNIRYGGKTADQRQNWMDRPDL